MKTFFTTNSPTALIVLATLTLLSSILSGCSSMGILSNEAARNTSPVLEAISPENPFAASDKIDLPNVALTDEILFKVVSAEIAFQRGDFPAAYATTVAVARKTHDPRLAKRAMEMALAAKQPLQAFAAARLWYEYAPHSNEATQYYLGFLIINNNLSEVNSIIAPRLAAATPKERSLILLQTQRLLMRGNDKEASFKVLEQLCKPYPEYVESRLALAQAAFATNNNVRAMAEAHAALKLNSSSQIAVLTLAQASPTPVAALKALSDFLAQNPTAYEVRRAYAGMLVEQKQFIQARTQFELLASQKPGDASNIYALGVLSLELNDAGSAEKYLSEFTQKVEAQPTGQPDPTSAYRYLSQLADDRHEGDNALNWLGKVQSYNGKNAAFFQAQLRRAVLMSKYGSLDQARQFLHGLKATPAEQIDIIQLEAELLRNANRSNDAMTLLQNAIRKNPNNADLIYNFAMIAEGLGRYNEMEKSLRRVIELNPDNQQAYNALGYSLADRNIRLDEARKLLEKALSLAPEDAFILDSMGWLEFREHKYEAALAYLQRAYKIRPDADIAVHIGEVLWVMGEEKKAKNIWKKAQQKDNQNPALKNTLERLKVSL